MRFWFTDLQTPESGSLKQVQIASNKWPLRVLRRTLKGLRQRGIKMVHFILGLIDTLVGLAIGAWRGAYVVQFSSNLVAKFKPKYG